MFLQLCHTLFNLPSNDLSIMSPYYYVGMNHRIFIHSSLHLCCNPIIWKKLVIKEEKKKTYIITKNIGLLLLNLGFIKFIKGKDTC